MTQTELTERNYFRESHLITNARASYTANEMDLILMLLTTVEKDDEDFKDYIFSIGELERKAGKKYHSEQLKETAKSLMSKVIEINIGKKSWELFNWFSYFKYDDGLITCGFDKRLKPYLLELKGRFNVGDIRQLLPMSSTYSKRIYMFLKERAKFGSRTFEIEELQDLLKTPKSLLNYADFKRRVLMQATKDINKYTDLEVSFTEEKLIRKVKKVTFTIRKNHQDLKAFIEYIRELHANEPLYESPNTGRILKCSTKGLLYYADGDNETLNKEAALKAWNFLHEKRYDLLIHRSLFNTIRVS